MSFLTWVSTNNVVLWLTILPQPDSPGFNVALFLLICGSRGTGVLQQLKYDGSWRNNAFAGQMLVVRRFINACCCTPAQHCDKVDSSRQPWLWLCINFFSLSARLTRPYPSPHPAVLLFWQLLKISWNNCKWVIISHLTCMQSWHQLSFACFNIYIAMPLAHVLNIWIANLRSRGTEVESNFLLSLLM